MKTLGELGEAGIIKKLSQTPLSNNLGVIRGIGDDAAVFALSAEHVAVVSTDLLVEDVDFRLTSTSPDAIGYKTAAVNLSDMAAMGARPRHAFLSLAAKKSTSPEFLDALFQGLNECLGRHDTNLLGGDLSRTDGPLTLSMTIVGEARPGQLIYRDGASAGDVLCVTDCLGEAAAGLRLLESGSDPDPRWELLVDALQRPRPQLDEGDFLAKTGSVSAMIDMSDGLSRDLRSLLQASKLGARIDTQRLPTSDKLREYCEMFATDGSELALKGGEEYCLLLALRPDEVSNVCGRFEARFARPLYQIGVTTENPEVLLSTPHGTRTLELDGYEHFS